MSDLPITEALYIVAVVASLAATGAAASRFVRADALDRALISLVAVIAMATGVPLLLGLFGVLDAGFYLAFVGAIGVASLYALLRGGRVPTRTPAAWSIAGLLALLSGSLLAVLAAVPTVRGLLSDHTDTRYYHITNLAHWFQTESIWGLPLQNHGFFTATHPGNGELSAIGWLFATNGDQLVYLTPILFGFLAVIACASIARSLDGRPDLGALAAIAVVSTPLVFGTEAHSLATDLMAAAPLLTGVAALLRAHSERDRRWVLVAGFALGFSIGAKYTVIFLVPLIALGALIALRPRKNVLWLVPGVVALGAPWFVRNWVETGNPLFPQRLGVGSTEIFEGGHSPLMRLSTTMLDHVLARRGGAITQWFDLVADLWGPALLIAVFAVLAVGLRANRHGIRLALAGLCVAAGFVYLITPFTGAGEEGIRFLMGSNIRYSLPFGLIGAALAAATLPSRVLNGLIGVSLAFNAYWMVHRYRFRTNLDLEPKWVAVSIVVALVVCAAVSVVGRRVLPAGLPVYAAGAVLLFVVMSGLVYEIDRDPEQTGLDRFLEVAAPGDITTIGVSEMRSVWGRNLDRNVETVDGGGRSGETPLTRDELDAAMADVDTDVLIVRPGTPAVPDGWKPPADDWNFVSGNDFAEVYVHEGFDYPLPDRST